MSTYNRRDQALSVIDDQSETTVEEVADIMVMDEEEIARYVETLKNRGLVYERDGKLRPA